VEGHVGIAGVNTRPNNKAVLGVAGVDRPSFGRLAIAGNAGSSIRPLLQGMTKKPLVPAATLGDKVQRRAWERAVYLSDWTYLVCTTPEGGLRWRNGFREMFGPEIRHLPVFLDSGSYRIFTGAAEKWASLPLYLQAIDLIKPEGYMLFDEIGNQEASLKNYELMVSMGYGTGLIPVWQMRQTYDRGQSVRANARAAARDPILRYYAERHQLLAIGGMVQGPCRREERHLYLAELCQQLPDHRFWALGQASNVVVNGLGQLGLLDRVSVDGSWWIHNARTESIALMRGGLIEAIRLEQSGARSFFTFSEMMACNLRSLLGAYSGAWEFPAPPPTWADLHSDPEARAQLKEHLAGEQMTLWNILDPSGTEG
jgi:hypothetical protein